MSELNSPRKFGRGCLRRFSLRMLLVLIALVGFWLGRQKQIVDERKAVRAWVVSHGIVDDWFDSGWTHQEANFPTGFSWCIRKAMGDVPAYSIILYYPTKEEHERVQRAFPEADLSPVTAEVDGERFDHSN